MPLLKLAVGGLLLSLSTSAFCAFVENELSVMDRSDSAVPYFPNEAEFQQDWERFQGFMAGQDKNLREAFDWDAWKQLNHDAFQAWEALVQCSGGDMRKARRNYYEGKQPCASREEGRRLQGALVALHVNLRDLALTSDTRLMAGLEDPQWMFGSKYEMEFVNLFKVLPTHPLLAQSVIELLARQERFARLNGEKYGAFEAGYGDMWLKLMNLLRREYGENSIRYTMFSFPEVNAAELEYARLYANANVFAAFLHGQRHGVGLWPLVSAFVLDMSARQAKPPMERVKAWQGVSLNAWDLDAIDETRKLGGKYGLPFKRNQVCTGWIFKDCVEMDAPL